MARRPRWLALESYISGSNSHLWRVWIGYDTSFPGASVPHFPSPLHSPWFPRSLPDLGRLSLLEGEASQGFPVPRPHRQLEGKCPSHKALWGPAALGGAVNGNVLWGWKGELQGLGSVQDRVLQSLCAATDRTVSDMKHVPSVWLQSVSLYRHDCTTAWGNRPCGSMAEVKNCKVFQ